MQPLNETTFDALEAVFKVLDFALEKPIPVYSSGVDPNHECIFEWMQRFQTPIFFQV